MSDLLLASGRPVLVVEDSDDDFDTVVQAAHLAQVRNPLMHAANADAALLLLAEPRLQPFAFMLLDCSLPGEDGLELLQALRRHKAHALLPVVVFTASVNPRDRHAFYLAGANAYHVKKVRFDECLACLQSIFHYWLTQVVLPETCAPVLFERQTQ
jgi:two-component system, chemotaxis family, chemotaxis protein CheY